MPATNRDKLIIRQLTTPICKRPIGLSCKETMSIKVNLVF